MAVKEESIYRLYSEAQIYRFGNKINDYALFYPIDERG